MTTRVSERIKSVSLEVVLWLLSLVIIVPLLVVLFGSVKTAPEAMRFSIALPTDWQFGNYVQVFREAPVARSLMNSLFITTVSVSLCVSSASLASYVIARRATAGMDALFAFFVFGIVVPISIIPSVFLMQALNIYGTFLSAILLYVAKQVPYSIFLFTGFMKGISRELDDAAIIDGCTPTQTFGRVILPLLKPILATNVVIITMFVWNDFMIPLYFLDSAKKWTLPLMVYNFFGRYFSNWNLVFADLVITAFPVLLLYAFGQRYLVAGMTRGAVKG